MSDAPKAEKAQTVHLPACHHVDPRESLNTCTSCGGSTLLDQPCQPARDVPLAVVTPPGNHGAVMTPGHRARALLAICAGAVILAVLVLLAIHLGHSPPT